MLFDGVPAELQHESTNGRPDDVAGNFLIKMMQVAFFDALDLISIFFIKDYVNEVHDLHQIGHCPVAFAAAHNE